VLKTRSLTSCTTGLSGAVHSRGYESIAKARVLPKPTGRLGKRTKDYISTTISVRMWPGRSCRFTMNVFVVSGRSTRSSQSMTFKATAFCMSDFYCRFRMGPS
jgi:hypothetical protein